MLIDTLTAKNYEDFKQRYNGCFGFIELENKKDILCRITGVSMDKVTFDTEGGQGFWAYCDQDVKFKFFSVTRGWFQSPGQRPVLFMRIPARQFSRGITSGNTSVMQWRLGRVAPIRIGFEELKSLFAPDVQVFDPKNGSAQLISKHFAVSPFIQGNCRELYLFDRVVGTIDGNKVTITHQPVKQEFFDVCRRKQLPLEIVE